MCTSRPRKHPETKPDNLLFPHSIRPTQPLTAAPLHTCITFSQSRPASPPFPAHGRKQVPSTAPEKHTSVTSSPSHRLTSQLRCPVLQGWGRKRPPLWLEAGGWAKSHRRSKLGRYRKGIHPSKVSGLAVVLLPTPWAFILYR